MKVFISYRSTQREIALRLREALRLRGYDVWMDYYDIPKMTYWIDQIDQGLVSSDIIIGCVSKISLASRNVQNEWDWCILHQKRLVFVLWEDIQSIHPRFANVPYISFVEAYKDSLNSRKVSLTNDTEQLERKSYELLFSALDRSFEDLPTLSHEALAYEVKEDLPVINSRTRFEESNWVNVMSRVLGHTDLMLTPEYCGVDLMDKPSIILPYRFIPNPALPIAPDSSRGNEIDSPAQKKIVDIYKASAGRLLITGQEGSGKTFVLLTLLRYLVDEAHKYGSVSVGNPENDQPSKLPLIPIYINAALWTAFPIRLYPDLMSFANQYVKMFGFDVHGFLNKVEKSQLLLVIDGLDQTTLYGRREDIVWFINTHAEDYPIVVTCNTHALQGLEDDLRLHRMSIEPLTSLHIEDFLREHTELETVRMALPLNSSLNTVAQDPLTLTLMADAYLNKKMNELLSIHDHEKRLTDLIESAFCARFPDKTDRHQARRLLRFIASATDAHPSGYSTQDDIGIVSNPLQLTYLQRIVYYSSLFLIVVAMSILFNVFCHTLLFALQGNIHALAHLVPALLVGTLLMGVLGVVYITIGLRASDSGIMPVIGANEVGGSGYMLSQDHPIQNLRSLYNYTKQPLAGVQHLRSNLLNRELGNRDALIDTLWSWSFAGGIFGLRMAYARDNVIVVLVLVLAVFQFIGHIYFGFENRGTQVRGSSFLTRVRPFVVNTVLLLIVTFPIGLTVAVLWGTWQYSLLGIIAQGLFFVIFDGLPLGKPRKTLWVAAILSLLFRMISGILFGPIWPMSRLLAGKTQTWSKRIIGALPSRIGLFADEQLVPRCVAAGFLRRKQYSAVFPNEAIRRHFQDSL